MMTNTSRRWLAFLTTAVVYGLSTRGGAHVSPDGELYVRLSNDLLRGDVSQTVTTSAVRWTKSVYLVILAAARHVTPAHWAEVMMAFNVLCCALIAVMLVDVMWRASRSEPAAAAALLLFLGCHEIIQWVPFIVTDILFTFVALIPFLLVARRILDPQEPPRTILLALSLLLTVVSRPPGVLIVPLVVFAELVLVRKRVRPRSAAMVIAAVVLAALFVRTAVVYKPSLWPFNFVRPKIEEFAGREKKGEVVYDQRYSYRLPPRTPADHLVIEADRFVRFFQITVPGYSGLHKAINVAYFVPAYLLSLVALLGARRNRDPRFRAFVVALAMWIGAFAMFHALTLLDYDFRFRVPALPYLILLASCGVDTLVRDRARRAAVTA